MLPSKHCGLIDAYLQAIDHEHWSVNAKHSYVLMRFVTLIHLTRTVTNVAPGDGDHDDGDGW